MTPVKCAAPRSARVTVDMGRSGKCNLGCKCGRHSCPSECSCVKHSIEIRYRESENLKKRWEDSEFRQTMVALVRNNKGRPGESFSDETKKKMSEAHERLWQNSDYAEMMMRARHIKPNKPELKLLNLIKSLGFSYVGDGKLVVGGKCPDFWDGAKSLIELFGEYWHKKSEVKSRVLHFKKLGYNCIVVWADELKEPAAVERRVREFVR